MRNHLTRSCVVCSKEFHYYANETVTGRGSYCSTECSGIGRRARTATVVIACEICGQEFSRAATLQARRPQRFCSLACFGLNRRNRVDRTCELCGKDFTVARVIAEKGDGRFCSRHCQNVRKFGTIEEKFWKKVLKTEDCWLWTGSATDKGYGVFQPVENVLRRIGAHRYSYQLHYGAIPKGQLVCHTCDNPPCIRPGHLFLGTPKENTEDMLYKERIGTTRFSYDEVRAIRERGASGESIDSIARSLYVHSVTIERMLSRRTYWYVA